MASAFANLFLGFDIMKKLMKKIISAVVAAVIIVVSAVTGFASEDTFASDAYATIITASDFQNSGTQAYDRFGKILDIAIKDGMPDADSMLVGGDYTMLLFDNAVPGISRIRRTYLDAFPKNDPASVVCIQGNHDNPKAEFTDTGFYNMGAYCLYVINENDFPWKQSMKKDDGVKEVAADIEKNLNDMIKEGDNRPVIVMTHVPLHHTGRSGYGDNMYASYIFNVLNEKGKQLDIVFIFGHNHSSAYDDYIGGSVNFMAPGEKIRIPFPDKKGEDCYSEETLNFTYTNCGYIGYSNNHKTETSTDILTLGFIQLTPEKLRFIKYSENGVYSVKEVGRVNNNSDVKSPEYPAIDDNCICHTDNPVLKVIWNVYMFFCRLFKINASCVCGERHY